MAKQKIRRRCGWFEKPRWSYIQELLNARDFDRQAQWSREIKESVWQRINELRAERGKPPIERSEWR